MILFSGRSNPVLSQKIADYLSLPLGDVRITPFPDGEVMVKVEEDIRGKDVYIIQPTCPPVNESADPAVITACLSSIQTFGKNELHIFPSCAVIL